MDPTNSATSIAAAGRRRPRGRRAEAAIAVSLLVLTLLGFVFFALRLRTPATLLLPALGLSVLLAGGYVAATVRSARLWLSSVVSSGPALGEPAGIVVTRAFFGPAVLLLAALVYCALSGLPLAPRAAMYGLDLLLPAAALFLLARFDTIALLAAATVFWLPLEFHLLPALPLPPVKGGWDATYLLALVNALYLILIVRRLPRVGLTFLLNRQDFERAIQALVVFTAVALPIGLATGFLRWDPRFTAQSLAGAPLAIYLGTAVPEEFLFRGVIQNACTRWLGFRRGLAVASVLFGLAHLPDLRYALLAAFAGVAYGWVYHRRGKVTASAVTHASVDWIWLLLLRR
jgi:membrane protease YdiL (CAAX protease family)